MMRRLAILFLMALTGCQLLGPDYKRAEPNLPAHFGEVDASVNATNEFLKQWWKHYQDDKLNELVALSLKNNTNIALAGARIEDADASMRAGGAALLLAYRGSGGPAHPRLLLVEAGKDPRGDR
jgi:multidrug efflux system outer membrane protein